MSAPTDLPELPDWREAGTRTDLTAIHGIGDATADGLRRRLGISSAEQFVAALFTTEALSIKNELESRLGESRFSNIVRQLDPLTVRPPQVGRGTEWELKLLKFIRWNGAIRQMELVDEDAVPAEFRGAGDKPVFELLRLLPPNRYDWFALEEGVQDTDQVIAAGKAGAIDIDDLDFREPVDVTLIQPILMTDAAGDPQTRRPKDATLVDRIADSNAVVLSNDGQQFSMFSTEQLEQVADLVGFRSIESMLANTLIEGDDVTFPMRVADPSTELAMWLAPTGVTEAPIEEAIAEALRDEFGRTPFEEAPEESLVSTPNELASRMADLIEEAGFETAGRTIGPTKTPTINRAIKDGEVAEDTLRELVDAVVDNAPGDLDQALKRVKNFDNFIAAIGLRPDALAEDPPRYVPSGTQDLPAKYLELWRRPDERGVVGLFREGNDVHGAELLSVRVEEPEPNDYATIRRDVSVEGDEDRVDREVVLRHGLPDISAAKRAMHTFIMAWEDRSGDIDLPDSPVRRFRPDIMAKMGEEFPEAAFDPSLPGVTLDDVQERAVEEAGLAAAFARLEALQDEYDQEAFVDIANRAVSMLFGADGPFGHPESARRGLQNWASDHEDTIGRDRVAAVFELGQGDVRTGGDVGAEAAETVILFLVDEHPAILDAAIDAHDEAVAEARRKERERQERLDREQELLDNPPAEVAGWERIRTGDVREGDVVAWRGIDRAPSGGGGVPSVVAVFIEPDTGNPQGNVYLLEDWREFDGDVHDADLRPNTRASVIPDTIGEAMRESVAYMQQRPVEEAAGVTGVVEFLYQEDEEGPDAIFLDGVVEGEKPDAETQQRARERIYEQLGDLRAFVQGFFELGTVTFAGDEIVSIDFEGRAYEEAVRLSEITHEGTVQKSGGQTSTTLFFDSEPEETVPPEVRSMVRERIEARIGEQGIRDVSPGREVATFTSQGLDILDFDLSVEPEGEPPEPPAEPPGDGDGWMRIEAADYPAWAAQRVVDDFETRNQTLYVGVIDIVRPEARLYKDVRTGQLDEPNPIQDDPEFDFPLQFGYFPADTADEAEADAQQFMAAISPDTLAAYIASEPRAKELSNVDVETAIDRIRTQLGEAPAERKTRDIRTVRVEDGGEFEVQGEVPVPVVQEVARVAATELGDPTQFANNERVGQVTFIGDEVVDIDLGPGRESLEEQAFRERVAEQFGLDLRPGEEILFQDLPGIGRGTQADIEDATGLSAVLNARSAFEMRDERDEWDAILEALPSDEARRTLVEAIGEAPDEVLEPDLGDLEPEVVEAPEEPPEPVEPELTPADFPIEREVIVGGATAGREVRLGGSIPQATLDTYPDEKASDNPVAAFFTQLSSVVAETLGPAVEEVPLGTVVGVARFFEDGSWQFDPREDLPVEGEPEPEPEPEGTPTQRATARIEAEGALRVNGWQLRQTPVPDHVPGPADEAVVEWANEAETLFVAIGRETDPPPESDEERETYAASMLAEVEAQAPTLVIVRREEDLEDVVETTIEWLQTHDPNEPWPEAELTMAGGLILPALELVHRFSRRAVFEVDETELAIRGTGFASGVEVEIPMRAMDSYDVSRQGTAAADADDLWAVVEDFNFGDTVQLAFEPRAEDHPARIRAGPEFALTGGVEAINPVAVSTDPFPSTAPSDASFTVAGQAYNRIEQALRRGTPVDAGDEVAFGVFEGVPLVVYEWDGEAFRGRFEVEQVMGELMVAVEFGQLRDLRRVVPRPASTRIAFTLKEDVPVLAEYDIDGIDATLRVALESPEAIADFELRVPPAEIPPVEEAPEAPTEPEAEPKETPAEFAEDQIAAAEDLIDRARMLERTLSQFDAETVLALLRDARREAQDALSEIRDAPAEAISLDDVETAGEAIEALAEQVDRAEEFVEAEREAEEEPEEEPPEAPEPEAPPEAPEPEFTPGQLETIIENATRGVDVQVIVFDDTIQRVELDPDFADDYIDPGAQSRTINVDAMDPDLRRTIALALDAWAEMAIDLDDRVMAAINTRRRALNDQFGLDLPLFDVEVEGLAADEIEAIVEQSTAGLAVEVRINPAADSLRISMAPEAVQFEDTPREVQDRPENAERAINEALAEWERTVDLTSVDIAEVKSARAQLAEEFGIELRDIETEPSVVEGAEAAREAREAIAEEEERELSEGELSALSLQWDQLRTEIAKQPITEEARPAETRPEMVAPGVEVSVNEAFSQQLDENEILSTEQGIEVHFSEAQRDLVHAAIAQALDTPPEKLYDSSRESDLEGFDLMRSFDLRRSSVGAPWTNRRFQPTMLIELLENAADGSVRVITKGAPLD